MQRKLRQNLHGFSMLVPMVLAVVIAFAVLFVGIFVNGEIDNSLQDTLPSDRSLPSSENTIANASINRLNNISGNQDSTIDIVQVVIIITILAAAIGAIFLFTRFGR